VEARVWVSEDKLSPELISVLWKKQGQEAVSRETLYQWIWKAKKSFRLSLLEDRGLYRHLRHGKRKQKRGNHSHTRGLIKHRTPIDQRPALIINRYRLGGVEVDLTMGKNHQSALLVTTDRATFYHYDGLPAQQRLSRG
jgi:IS30 family transposase